MAERAVGPAPRGVFESAAVVVADKPAGVLTVPSRIGDADVRACFGRDLEAALGVRLWPVHRLDFEVSGLVLFAKTDAAHRIANAAFESRQVEKRYQALSEGAAFARQLPANFAWESLIVRGKRRSFEAPHGKAARTLATAREIVESHMGPLLLWDLAPETGRPHQLRVHLARAGFPVAGDRLYGARLDLGLPDTIALRSVALTFTDLETRAALGLPATIEVDGIRAALGAEAGPRRATLPP
ncbi:MAG TPA: RNA pseudouridine synthase [Polyangia bacterium]